MKYERANFVIKSESRGYLTNHNLSDAANAFNSSENAILFSHLAGVNFLETLRLQGFDDCSLVCLSFALSEPPKLDVYATWQTAYKDTINYFEAFYNAISPIPFEIAELKYQVEELEEQRKKDLELINALQKDLTQLSKVVKMSILLEKGRY